jgi:hypothetical protein
MQHHLVVISAFGAHAKGDVITDAETIARVLTSENADAVVRVQLSIEEG